MTPIKITGMAVLLVLGLGIADGLWAEVPDNLSYQGFLRDSAGPVSGPVSVEFALYTVEDGGVSLWTEAQVVNASDGVFTALLGEGLVPFPLDLFDVPLFLGIRIESGDEMTPRTPLTSSAYSHKARDANTLGGIDASQLDQSDEVSVLTADLTAVENTLTTLQPLVTQSCSPGSSIRQVFPNGTVTCEDTGESYWGLLNENVYYTSGRVGIGTMAPAAAIQIDAPLDVDPFRARVQSATKLRVHTNGSVSVGTSSAGPDDGLYVLGDARFGAGSSTARMTVTDPLWQMALDNTDAGGDDWFVGSTASAWAIGGGKYVISPSESSSNSALVIDSNKDVGIGILDPLSRVHIGGGTDVSPSGGGFLIMGSINTSNIAIDNNEIMARNNGAATTLALNAEGGKVTINSGGSRDSDALEIRGRVYFDNGGNSGMRMTATTSTPTNALLEPTGFEEGLIGSSSGPFWRMYSREFYASTPADYRTYSDRSLKQNIVKIPAALDTIMALEGVTYELIKHPMNNKLNERELTDVEIFIRDHQLGFIAQDLEQVLPQLVSEDETSGLKTVGYMGLIPVLVEAVKEQQRQIDAQWEEIELLRAQLESSP